MARLELVEEVASSLPQSLYRDITELTLKTARYTTEGGFRIPGKKVTLNAIAVSEKKIRSLNREYRNRDKATDILSFGEDLQAMKEKEKEIFLGELFFSPRFIRRQAKADRRPYRQAMIYIFSHGILHLLGYDHGTAMFAYQDEVTAALFPAREAKTKKEKTKKKKNV